MISTRFYWVSRARHRSDGVIVECQTLAGAPNKDAPDGKWTDHDSAGQMRGDYRETHISLRVINGLFDADFSERSIKIDLDNFSAEAGLFRVL